MASAAPLTTANTGFVLDMLKKLRGEDKKENVLFCPVSLSAGLAMVLLGAKGNTAKQISKVLQLTETKPKSLSATPMQSLLKTRTEARMQMHTQIKMQIRQRSRMPDYLTKVRKSGTDKDAEQTDKGDEETAKGATETSKDEAQNGSDGAQTSQGETQAAEEVSQTEKDDAPAAQDDVHAKLSELLSPFFKDDAPFGLSLANRLYGEKSCEFLKGFSEETKKLYNAELEPVDFKGNAETERVNINSWVEKQTQDKIKNLLAEGSLTSTTKLMLINAAYFKNLWEKKFEVEETETEFKITATDTKRVKMMRQKSTFHVASIPESRCKILSIPCIMADLSVVIILPDEPVGLEELENELTPEKFEAWTSRPISIAGLEVAAAVKLPRFKMEKTYSLGDALKSLGVADAFNDTKSDFSGLSAQKGVVLSSVVHKVSVEVDESGGEAAASSSPEGESGAEAFTADHPFLFFMQHKPTKTVLLAGRYSSPE